MQTFRLIPEQASTFAKEVDPLFWALSIFVGAFTIIVFAVVIYWGVKYRKKEGENRKSYHPELLSLEIGAVAVLTVLALGIFWWGAVVYFSAYNIPAGTLDLNVIGKQWMWKIQHPNGKREVNELHIPVGQPVKLTMTSQDVIHSFFIPAFRKKQDVLPGKYSTMWFEATRTGEFPLFCAEYCGTEHSTMTGRVVVMEPQDYVAWLSGTGAMTPAEAGADLFGRLGCATCHDAGAGSRGPNLAGIFGSEVAITGGAKVVADEEYIRESILTPSARIVEGYAPLMPSFANQLKDEDVNNLVAYVKSLAAQ